MKRFLPPALAVLGFLTALFLTLRFLPYPELGVYRGRAHGLAILDRNGRVLRVLPAPDGVKREWAPLEEFPAGVRRIFIRAEDRRFYFHPGVDLISAAGSALRNLRAGRVVSGASTITMQLARLIRPRGPGLGGKVAEAWDALRLEARLTKGEILELWLNGIPFGSNIEGLPAITRARFGIPLAQLDDPRAALLAVIPRRPGRYDPAVDPAAAAGAALSLSLRCRLGLNEELIREAAREAARRDMPEKAPFYAPHFTGRLAARGPEFRGPGPGPLRSTLDLGFQTYTEERLETELSMLSRNRVSNGAVLAIENETGAVRVYVGSASWFDEDRGGKIDGVRVLNQPGSCLKPFLYALALDSGFSPARILPDLPTIFGGREAYIPSNFNRRFNGPVRFRVALASSLNIPAVYLLERLGVGAFEDYLISLGFDSIAAGRGSHGTGLALGNAEVSLEELVRAFSVFPRGGSLPELRWREDAPASGAGTPASGRTDQGRASGFEASPGKAEPPVSPYAAALIADILSDRASRFVGFGPAPALATEFESLFKTGTANQFQHIWALGATRRFTVGVWMGNFSGETVVGRTGSSIPARIAADLLGVLEASGPSGGDRPPQGDTPLAGLAEQVEICALSGMAAAPACPGTLTEWIPRDRIPALCNWHGAGLVRYPPEYQAWLAEHSRPGAVAPQGPGLIRIPVPGSVYYLDPSLPAEAQALRVETLGFSPGALVYADGLLQGGLDQAGLYVLPLSRGSRRLLVEDENGAAAVDFEVR
jgi:penicillin-binding protein 1C